MADTFVTESNSYVETEKQDFKMLLSYLSKHLFLNCKRGVLVTYKKELSIKVFSFRNIPILYCWRNPNYIWIDCSLERNSRNSHLSDKLIIPRQWFTNRYIRKVHQLFITTSFVFANRTKNKDNYFKSLPLQWPKYSNIITISKMKISNKRIMTKQTKPLITRQRFE